jgi:predicted DNA-binding protein
VGTKNNPGGEKFMETEEARPSRSPRRGRPAREIKKHAVTCYLTDETHEKLRLLTRASGKPMTVLIEEVVSRWLNEDKNGRAIVAARRLTKLFGT